MAGRLLPSRDGLCLPIGLALPRNWIIWASRLIDRFGGLLKRTTLGRLQ